MNKYTSKFTTLFKINKTFLKPLEVLEWIIFGGEQGGKGSLWFGFCFVLGRWLAVFFHKRKKNNPGLLYTKNMLLIWQLAID